MMFKLFFSCRFLLDQSERMLKLLYTAPSNIPEIDYLLLIRMIKSLAMAAKMLCSESNLDWGVSSAGKIISQADTFTLLIEHGCLHLLPLNVTQEAVLDTATLRRVRDKLMEDEQWETALELSTKSGLDKTGESGKEMHTFFVKFSRNDCFDGSAILPIYMDFF